MNAPFPRGCETYGLFAPGYQDLTADAVFCPYRGVQCPFHLPDPVSCPHRGIRLGFCTGARPVPTYSLITGEGGLTKNFSSVVPSLQFCPISRESEIQTDFCASVGKIFPDLEIYLILCLPHPLSPKTALKSKYS